MHGCEAMYKKSSEEFLLQWEYVQGFGAFEFHYKYCLLVISCLAMGVV